MPTRLHMIDKPRCINVFTLCEYETINMTSKRYMKMNIGMNRAHMGRGSFRIKPRTYIARNLM